MKLTPEVWSEARELIGRRLGLDFPDGRQADLERGLVRAIDDSKFREPSEYLSWLASAPDADPALRRLAAGLTVGETYFFRDHACFDALRDRVLPVLIAARRSQRTLRLRLWSAGCATGEEAYSLAILLDQLLPDRSDWSVTILATDIDAGALERARSGSYREWSFRQTPPDLRGRYFRACGNDGFEVEPAVRRAVAFAPLNLAADVYPDVITNTTAMDLVLCRNVLMYFTREAQRAAAARLTRALANGGWLVVSAVEASAAMFEPLEPVNLPGVILFRKAPGSTAWSDVTNGAAPADEPAAPWPPPDVSPTGPSVAESEQAVTVRAAASPLHRARALADQGRLDEAQRLCQAALARDRLDLDTHLLLAAICQEGGLIPAALDALRAALYLAPDNAVAHFLLGGLLLRQGQRRRGRRCMQTAATLLTAVVPDDPVLGGGGLTAGRLLEAARGHLEPTA